MIEFDCGHSDYKKHGFARNGKQRYKCRVCGRTIYEVDTRTSLRLPPEKERQLETLIATGSSQREIAKRVGCCKSTVGLRKAMAEPIEELSEPASKPGIGCCHYCGKRIEGSREFDRATSRTKHPFCDAECYRKYCLVTDEKRLINYLQWKTKDGEKRQSNQNDHDDK